MAGSPEDETYRTALDHTWSWFTIHASQRLQLVNFWIVSVAFITAALVTAITKHAWGVATLVALLGGVATVCFQRLERRTRQLVRAAEAALRHFQRDLAARTDVPEMEILSAVDKYARFGSYGVVISFMHWFVTAAFGASATYSIAKWIW